MGAPKGGAPKGGAPKGGAPEGGGPNGGGPNGGGPNGGGPKGGEPEPGKSGAPKGGAPKGGGPNGGGPKISRFFFPSPAGKFALFFPLWGSSRGILVVFEAPGRSNVHVWSSRAVVCEPRRPGLVGPPGFHTTAREPKRVHLRVPVFKNTTKIQRKRPKEREKRMKTVVGEGKKERNFGRSGGGRSGGEALNTPTTHTTTTTHNTQHTTHNTQHTTHNTTTTTTPENFAKTLQHQNWPKSVWPKSVKTLKH